MTRLAYFNPRRVKLLELENNALRKELIELKRFLDASRDRIEGITQTLPKHPIPTHPLAHDGWRELALTPEGQVMVGALGMDGEAASMALSEAREALPDWEFKEEVKDGVRRVYAR